VLRAEPRVLFRQASQRGIDGLLLGADQADLHFAAIGKREDLRRSMAVSVMAQQLEPVWLLRAMMKNHGPSGEA